MMETTTQFKTLSVEAGFCLALAYALTTYPFRYGELVPQGNLWAPTALSLAGLSLLPLPYSLRPLVRLIRVRTGANERLERRLSTLSLEVFMVASITLYFATDLWDNIVWKVVTATPLIDRLAGAVPDLRLAIFCIGFVWLLIPFHFTDVASFINRRRRVVRISVRKMRKMFDTVERSPWRLSELVTPYPQCSEVEPNSIVGLLGAVEGHAGMELVGCRNAVAILSAWKEGDSDYISRALSLTYDSMKACDFLPTRGMMVKVGHYVAGAYGSFSENELCSLQDFEKSNDVLSNVANVMTHLDKGCGGRFQVIIKRKSYRSIASRMLRRITPAYETREPSSMPTEPGRVADEIRRKTSLPTFSVAINVLAWAPTPQLAEATLEAICSAITLHGDYGFIMMKRAHGYDMCRHVYARKAYRELPFSNKELANLIHMPVKPCRGLPIVQSSPRAAGRFSEADEDGVKVGWELG